MMIILKTFAKHKTSILVETQYIFKSFRETSKYFLKPNCAFINPVFLLAEVDIIKKVPEGVNAMSEAALNTFTKVAKRTLRKGLFGGTERDNLVKVST